MKLSDIDTILSAKSEYHSCRDQLTNMKKNACYDLRFYNSSPVTNPKVLAVCRDTAIQMFEVELEELKTKLMLYGVDDFEGYD